MIRIINLSKNKKNPCEFQIHARVLCYSFGAFCLFCQTKSKKSVKPQITGDQAGHDQKRQRHKSESFRQENANRLSKYYAGH